MINGATEDRFLDDARFEPILAAAEALDVPIYLHPGLAPEPVRRLYYSGLPSDSGVILEGAGGAGTRRRQSTCCGWCCRARSTATRN
jgi:hypothetical protein